MPRSSSGPGRWVFVPEITGSTPVRGTEKMTLAVIFFSTDNGGNCAPLHGKLFVLFPKEKVTKSHSRTWYRFSLIVFIKPVVTVQTVGDSKSKTFSLISLIV